MSAVRAALYQGPFNHPDASADTYRAAIGDAARRAADGGAHILICPELATSGYNVPGLRELAEPADGPLAARVAELAHRHHIAIVYGYPERVGDDVYNTVRVVGADGQTLAEHRKTHLFGELDRRNFRPGDRLIDAFTFAGFHCALLICYEVEFPENVRALADSGVEWIIVPTGLMDPYTPIATRMVPSRAMEAQAFITYVNRVGQEGDLRYCGNSCAVSPSGEDVVRAGVQEELLFADLDRDVLARTRADFTYAADRRTDL